MNPFVLLTMASMIEFLVTLEAAVWHLTSVDSLMNLQITFQTECFVTLRTLKPYTGFLHNSLEAKNQL